MEGQKKSFTASLHTHVRSLHDAHIEAKELCEKIIELGGKGCAITDHGVLSSIEDYRVVFKEYGLKMIPGCELYVDGGILGKLHLIVLAANDNGYKGVSKIVTESNRNLINGTPVITQEKLFEMVSSYKGDIISLSGCMQGVISAIFLQNSHIDNKVESIRAKQVKYVSPDDPRVTKAEKDVKDAEDALAELMTKRDTVKRTAEQKFSKREREIAKLKKGSSRQSNIEYYYKSSYIIKNILMSATQSRLRRGIFPAKN